MANQRHRNMKINQAIRHTPKTARRYALINNREKMFVQHEITLCPSEVHFGRWFIPLMSCQIAFHFTTSVNSVWSLRKQKKK